MYEKFGAAVIGSGIAGLSACLEASKNPEKSVALLDTFNEKASNSFYAQGGIAAAAGESDSWEKHAADTIKAGAGLCDEKIVELVVRKGIEAVKELQGLGLEFDSGDGKPALGLEGGHSEKRILHIQGDKTGKGITSFLKALASERGNVYFFGNTFLEKILVKWNEFSGLKVLGGEEGLRANSLVMATGGFAGLFEKTTNPETTRGSGIAAAFEAGCHIKDLEFVQFHPTTIKTSAGGNFLVTEAVRGEGGAIVNSDGEKIVDPLFTRDKVSRAIYMEIMRGKKVFLDATMFEAGFFRERFPSVYSALREKNLNPEKDLIPIETAAHYTIGGISIDENARTNVKGIYACGECSRSGLHGANRLASNSLLEGLVFGKIAGKNAAEERGLALQLEEKSGTRTKGKASEFLTPETVLKAAGKILWDNCGVVRNRVLLEKGLMEIRKLEQGFGAGNGSVETASVAKGLLVARKTFEAALARNESVGVHFRES